MNVNGVRKYAFGRARLWLVAGLLLGAGLLFASCGSSEESKEPPGPLTASEKAYIKDAEAHQKQVPTNDAELTTRTLQVKQQYPQAGLPTDILKVTQDYLDTRSKAIRSWEDTGCPSKRLGTLCDLWIKELQLQDSWDNRFVEFINAPYSADQFKAIVETGREAGTAWKRCEAEIKKLERDAGK